MVRDLDILHLRAFVTVSEVGSVTRAAHRLSRTQAAISMQLQNLERDVGASLLHRTPRGVTLTDAGHILLAYARKTLALGEDVRREIAGQRLAGRVRLGIIEDLAMTRLPVLLAEFRQRHSQVDLDLVAGGSSNLARGFGAAREFDIVVADPARFSTLPVAHWSRQLVWCVSRLMALPAAGEPIPIVMTDGPCSWQDRMLTLLATTGRAWRPECRAGTYAALLAAVRAGLGVGLMLPECVPPDCGPVDAALGLPPAPHADFGLFVAATANQIGQELGRFLQTRMLQ